MTESRPYRAGLGIPPAIVIKSDPPPSTRQRQLFEEGSASLSDLHVPQLNPNQVWKEWNINPAKHGPEASTRPPTFVPSSNVYDELGRSRGDGVGVEIDEGEVDKRKGKEVLGGAEMADWYRTLSSSRKPSRSGTPGVDGDELSGLAMRGTECDPDEVVVESVLPSATRKQSRQRSSSPALDSDQNAEAGPSRLPNTRKPLIRVHRREWFIRRALVNQPSSTSNTGPQQPSSIGSLLNIPAQTRVPIARYVLGPDNKGYEMLRDQLGWEGGGLGRPIGWEDARQEAQLGGDENSARSSGVEESKDVENARMGKSEDASADVMELDGNGNPVVDLTLDSDSDTEAGPSRPPGRTSKPHGTGNESHTDDFDTGFDSLVQPTPSGPGRTAPIPTMLKLDRRGLGHRTKHHTAVTHTAEEIRKAQMRSRYPPPRAGVELGKKGKVRWKERDKREREERRRLLGVLNG